MDNFHKVGPLILRQALGGTLSESERLELEEFKTISPYHAEIPDLFKDQKWLSAGLREIDSFPRERIKQELMKKMADSGLDQDQF